MHTWHEVHAQQRQNKQVESTVIVLHAGHRGAAQRCAAPSRDSRSRAYRQAARVDLPVVDLFSIRYRLLSGLSDVC